MLKAIRRCSCPHSALSAFLGGVFLLFATPAEAQPAAAAEEVDPDAPAAEGTTTATDAASEEPGDPEVGGEATAEVNTEVSAELDTERARVAELEKRLEALEAAEAARAEEAELAEIMGDEAEAAELAESQMLKMYGFMDFGFQKAFFGEKSQTNTLFATDASTFVLGNLNVFLDAEPHPDWRGLIELRFTNLPHGVETLPDPATGSPYQRTNTEVVDYTSPSFRNRVTVGSTIIERAWMQWTGNDQFKVRSGLFLTPFGIWNVDHGTPTLISLLLPSGIADQLFPDRQLGVQVLGNAYSGDWEVGYHAYLSNGRGIGTGVDFTEEKAFGGRAYLASFGGIKPKLGVSGYYGEAIDVEKEIVSPFPLEVNVTETVSFREWVLGADAAADVGDLRLRGEIFVRHRKYEPFKRLVYDYDGYLTSGYLLAAYRLPWAGLEPYLYGEAVHYASMFADTTILPSVGLNIHFSPRVQLKTQALYAFFMDLSVDEDRVPSDNNAATIATRLVMSF